MWSFRNRVAGMAALSVVAGVGVAVLTNVATDRPGPAVIVGLVAATAIAAGLAAAFTRSGQQPDQVDHAQIAESGGRITDTHVDVDAATPARTRQQARDGGTISGSSITVRQHPAEPPRPGPRLPEDDRA